MRKARKRTNQANRYMQIIEQIFLERYHDGAQEVPFERDDFVRHAELLKIKLPKNLSVNPVPTQPSHVSMRFLPDRASISSRR
jgi:hypothetical protein